MQPSAARHGRTQTGKNLVIVYVMAVSAVVLCVCVRSCSPRPPVFIFMLSEEATFVLYRTEREGGGWEQPTITQLSSTEKLRDGCTVLHRAF